MKYILLLLIAIPLASFAEIYKWIDADGHVHYGDAPKEKDKAEKVALEINSYEHVTYQSVDFNQGPGAGHVTMYATSWCGYCKKARTYFRQNGINFIEYDIEKDEWL